MQFQRSTDPTQEKYAIYLKNEEMHLIKLCDRPKSFF